MLVLHGLIPREEVRWMCERVRFLLQASDSEQVICDVGALLHPDAGTIETLARMQLAAQRLGGRLRIRRACGELKDLLEFSGLTDVLPCDDLPLEPSGHAEQGEPAGGVEEERDPADPIV